MQWDFQPTAIKLWPFAGKWRLVISKHLLKRLEWFRKTDPELTESGKTYRTYAYYVNNIENMDDIKAQFRYISDRWNCPGRIKFMLEVIKRGI